WPARALERQRHPARRRVRLPRQDRVGDQLAEIELAGRPRAAAACLPASRSGQITEGKGSPLELEVHGPKLLRRQRPCPLAEREPEPRGSQRTAQLVARPRDQLHPPGEHPPREHRADSGEAADDPPCRPDGSPAHPIAPSISRYPTPQTLMTNLSPRPDSLARSRDAWESSVRVVPIVCQPQTPRSSSSRVNTRVGS